MTPPRAGISWEYKQGEAQTVDPNCVQPEVAAGCDGAGASSGAQIAKQAQIVIQPTNSQNCLNRPNSMVLKVFLQIVPTL